ncbi:MAG: pyridoxal kinase PdxY [Comamonas sp.]
MSTSAKPVILSIQSNVAWGYVGNSAAVFALQRLGFDVLQVHTVLFSNHTGYGQFRGQILSAEHIRDILDGLRDRGVLQKVGAVLSGYLGNADTGAVILDAVNDIRHTNPGLCYLCDPVMGDVGRGLFVSPAIPTFLRDQAIPFANIITPNQFEFELLTGSKLASVEEAVTTARQLRGRGPRTIIITSLATPDIAPDELGTLAVNGDGAWLVTTPRLDLHPLPNGMGAVFAATLVGRLMDGKALPEALELATATLYSLVKATAQGSRDLPLISEQVQLVAPSERFNAKAV